MLYGDRLSLETTLSDYVSRIAKSRWGGPLTDHLFRPDLPEKVEISGYYLDKLRESEAEVRKLEVMTVEEQEVAAVENYERVVASYQKIAKERLERRRACERMLLKVDRWKQGIGSENLPIESLYIHMVEGLRWEIEHAAMTDRACPEKLSSSAWYLRRLQTLHEDIAYYRNRHQEEVEYVEEMNRNLKELRASLELFEGLNTG